MTPERWKKIDELLQSALAHSSEERPEFLAQACAGDEPLRREVESLIASHQRAGHLLDTPLSQVAAELLDRDQAPLRPGQKIGSYEIANLLGKGGMGDVYLAEDTRLGRKVALKLLPAYFTKDEDRLRRFEQEARAASALNHPNILTIYEIGQVDGHRFIATEFVDGLTLRQHIAQINSLPAHDGNSGKTLWKLSEVIEVGTQVAGALTAAHAAGIVHRDIKPENLMVRSDGYVKVLDFGLAKLTESQSISASAEAPTKLLVHTSPGLVMGTVQYMSPEQARGLAVDARTDIWSLGVVLYEMLIGKAPFEGETPSHVIVSILEKDPPQLSDYWKGMPAELNRILNKAMRKNREDRYQSVKDLALDLKNLKQELEISARLDISQAPNSRAAVPGRLSDHSVTETAQTHTPSTADLTMDHSTLRSGYPISERAKRFGWQYASLLVLLVIGVAAAVFIAFRPARSPLPATRTRPFTTYSGNENNPSFSPDGNQIAFVWDGPTGDNYDIYVKLIDAGTPLRLTTNPHADSYPAWSPDGRYIAFVRSTESGAGVYLIAALGGSERKVGEIHLSKHFLGTRLSWSPDGKFLAVSDYTSLQEPTAIFLLTVESGEKQRVTSPPTGTLGDFFPAISPDGKSLAFARVSGWGVEDIYIMPLAGGEAKRLTFDNAFTGGITWTTDSREILFASSRFETSSLNLWRLSTTGGAPEKLPIASKNVLSPTISRVGNRLAYGQVSDDTNIWRVDASGSNAHVNAATKLIASTRYDMGPQYSPDGKRIAFDSDRSGSFEICVSDADGGNPVQLTNTGGALTGFPRWSPDGKQIAFYSQAAGNSDIYVINADGGKPRRLTTEPSEDMASSWSRDGRSIYFGSNRTGEWQIWKMPAEGGQATQVTKQGGFNSVESFDSKYLYYTKGSDIVGIWRVPVEGGEEKLVLDRYKAGYWDYWALVEHGIYFATDETPVPSIQFFNFATGQVSEVTKLEKEKAPQRGAEAGLSVSPDGRWLIYPQRDQRGSDIMLMENFR